MPRIIEEREKRQRREVALRQRRIAKLVSKGWSESDARITVNAVHNAKDIAAMAKLARQLGQAAQARNLDIVALDVVQPAVHLARKNGVPFAEQIAEAFDRKRIAYGAPAREKAHG